MYLTLQYLNIKQIFGDLMAKIESNAKGAKTYIALSTVDGPSRWKINKDVLDLRQDSEKMAPNDNNSTQSLSKHTKRFSRLDYYVRSLNKA